MKISENALYLAATVVDQDPSVDCGVYFEENKLRQVLINLLGNAIKFTTEGEIKFQVESPCQDRYIFKKKQV